MNQRYRNLKFHPDSPAACNECGKETNFRADDHENPSGHVCWFLPICKECFNGTPPEAEAPAPPAEPAPDCAATVPEIAPEPPLPVAPLPSTAPAPPPAAPTVRVVKPSK